ncbi:MAG TPA: ABC transporter substrate-binding protein [Bryobacteraceae bacterium]|nr:ABC transporter substrate-binding protein [Bryobacteraceae bacterium]
MSGRTGHIRNGFFCWLVFAATAWAQWGGELRLALRAEPRSLNPALAESVVEITYRDLTGGMLVRLNRVTQELEPELAVSWTTEDAGRTIIFHLRKDVCFSDGTPFTAGDVAYTMRVLMDPALHSPTGDAFRSGQGELKTIVRDPYTIAIRFPAPVASAARLFDQVAIMSRRSQLKEAAVLGPFHLAERKSGSYIRLARNPNYWKTDRGRRLPYLDSVRLEIQPNRELELVRFNRGDLHMISDADPELFDRVAASGKAWTRDAGPTLEGELLWFNMNPAAPVADYAKRWFNSQNFRLAVSHAIHRDDLCRVVYRGHAQPGIGPFSPANRFWFNQKLKPHAFDLKLANQLLAADGFHRQGGALRDASGHAVEFSLVTNAGNRAREREAAMIQQDLAALGIRLNIVTLDFAALIQRITQTFQYEAVLLGLTNVDLDPDGQMNLWLSSSVSHAWNPNQKSPATPWEAELDRLMQAQASTIDPARRKALFDRVQEIVWQQAPVLYLLNTDALEIASPALRNLAPAVLRPQLLWNIDRLYLAQAK